jgi:FixJ family two-component response regulator
MTRLLRLSGYETAQYESASALIDGLPNDPTGCILLDLDMPKMNGLQLQAHLAMTNRSLPLVFLTGRGNILSSVKAMKAGAEDFLCKPVQHKVLLAAVNRAIERNKTRAETREQHKLLHARFELLTPREMEVFYGVVAGKLNKEIAHQLSISVRTVKAHRQKMMRKIQLRRTIDLVSFAERLATKDDPNASHNDSAAH